MENTNTNETSKQAPKYIPNMDDVVRVMFAIESALSKDFGEVRILDLLAGVEAYAQHIRDELTRIAEEGANEQV